MTAMRLSDWMGLHGYDDTKVAKLVGVAQSTINRIRNGVTKPSGNTMARIEEVTGGECSAKDFFPNTGNR
jgi:DNA-binding transcriptional regulator YdaS (Cro superfamily)